MERPRVGSWNSGFIRSGLALRIVLVHSISIPASNSVRALPVSKEHRENHRRQDQSELNGKEHRNDKIQEAHILPTVF
jgi:hypothetical protein